MGFQASALRPGYVLGGMYEVCGELGRGSMSVVYRAHRLLGGGEVAVKLLDPARGADHASVGRFWQEVALTRQLQHPNIIQIFDFGRTEDGVPYLVEELLDGYDLQALLDAGAVYTSSQIVSLLAPVCEALAAAHAAGIIHRDLKPANLFVTRAGTVKLIDFGLAKINDCNASSYTGHFGIVGTPAYMSPEHLRGEELDARADLYALGVIAYQLLCGALPFEGRGYVEIGEKILHQAPEDVRRGASERELPSGLARLTMQALSKDRNDRPRTALAFARRLRAALEIENAPARLARAVFARLQALQQNLKAGASPLVQSLKRPA